MEAEKVEQLSPEEYELIGNALYELMKRCPYIPKKTELGYQIRAKGVSLSLVTVSSVVKNRDILDGFTAEVRFQIAYKSFPSTNLQRINAQAVLDKIIKWFTELTEYPELTEKRKITSISAAPSLPFVDRADADGNVVFAADAVMEYKKKGE